MNEAEQQQEPGAAKGKKAGGPARDDASKMLREAIDVEVCKHRGEIAKSIVRGMIESKPKEQVLLLDRIGIEKKKAEKKAVKAGAAKPVRRSRGMKSRALELAREAQLTADDEEALEKAEADRARSGSRFEGRSQS